VTRVQEIRACSAQKEKTKGKKENKIKKEQTNKMSHDHIIEADLHFVRGISTAVFPRYS
jgi:hypothetical protein